MFVVVFFPSHNAFKGYRIVNVAAAEVNLREVQLDLHQETNVMCPALRTEVSYKCACEGIVVSRRRILTSSRSFQW